jgi:hypothetical protein
MTQRHLAALALLCLPLACAWPDAALRVQRPIVLNGEAHDNARHHALQRSA